MEENLSIIKEIHQQTGEKGNDIRTYSPLTLAYIGDAAYEIVIRTLIVEKGQQAVHALHKQTTRIVCASAQAAVVEAIQDVMTEKELDIYRRGKNSKINSSAKNMSLEDYRKDTGFGGCMRISVSAGRDCPHCRAGEDRAGQTGTYLRL